MSTATPFAGLHQWEPDDSVLRESFNEDFRKIDTGLKALAEAAPEEKLFDIAVTSPVSTISLNLTGLDWSRYHELVIYAVLSNSESVSSNAYLQANRIGGNSYTSNNTSGAAGMANMSMGSTPGMLVIHVPCGCFSLGMYGTVTPCTGDSAFFHGGMYYTNPLTLAQVTSLDFNNGRYDFSIGSKVTVYGVKKR